MSKLVNWGRWVVAVNFAVDLLAATVALLTPVFYLALGEKIFHLVYVVWFLALIPALALAWGLLKFRHWAHVLALVLAITYVLMLPFIFKDLVSEGVGIRDVLEFVVFLACSIWLLLPEVRSAYSRRNSFA